MLITKPLAHTSSKTHQTSTSTTTCSFTNKEVEPRPEHQQPQLLVGQQLAILANSNKLLPDPRLVIEVIAWRQQVKSWCRNCAHVHSHMYHSGT